MYVGLLIYGSLDTISGGFIYDRQMVRYLREQGNKVEVITLPWHPYPRGLLENLDFLLQRRLQQAKFHILLQDELVHPSCFWLNQRLRRRINYPIVAIVHHLRCREQRPVWLNRLYREVEKRYLNSVDGFVCVSRTTKGDVEDLVGQGMPLIVAAPGRDALPWDITPEEIRTRATIPGPLQIIFIGNVIPRKELHTLLTALAHLSGRDWRLTIAGSLESDTAYVKVIRRQIKETGLMSRVSLLGTLTPRELAARCIASHVLTVPSSYEGFGIVYLEGMYFGLPAIASTAGAAKEIIRHGENGFLILPGDSSMLAQCLDALMKDRRRLLKMSLNAYHRALIHPTWNDSAARFHTFLQSLLKDFHRKR